MSQTLRIKLRESGIFRLTPKTLALMAVQRQAAASRFTSPPKSLQHGFFGGVPPITPSNPPNTLPHTSSFRASLGQVPGFGGLNIGVVGPGRGPGNALGGSGKNGFGGLGKNDLGGERNGNGGKGVM